MCRPEVNATASAPCSEVLPTKMAKARPREIEREAMRMATAKENTMPMFANVRSMPEAMPYASGGAAFITAGRSTRHGGAAPG